MLIGILSGLSAAVIWSASSLLVKAQAARIDTLSFNSFRFLIGALFFWLILPFVGGVGELASLSWQMYAFLIGSVLLGFCVGDSLYFYSLTAIGASRAMPLSGIYPLFTWMLAVPLLHEPIDWLDIVGTGCILVSLAIFAREVAAAESSEVVVVALDSGEVDSVPRTTRAAARRKWIGIGAALLTALVWAIATTMLRLGLSPESNAVAVNAFRLTVAAIVLLPVLYWLRRGQPWQNYSRRSLPRLVALAIFSTGIGSILFVWAVQFAGAARASLIITASPLLGVPLSAIFLHERVTRVVWLGTLLAVFGVWLVLV